MEGWLHEEAVAHPVGERLTVVLHPACIPMWEAMEGVEVVASFRVTDGRVEAVS